MTLDTLSMLVVVFVVAAIAPFVVDRVERWFALPSVVVEIILGILVGPAVLGLVSHNDVVEALADLGLAFLMFLAGYEINFARIRGDPLRRAAWSWLLSLVLGLAMGLLIAGATGGLVIGLALTTTALAMILPIIRDSGEISTPFGDRVLAVGTLGEFGPIIAIAFVLSGERPRHTLVVLVIFVVLALAGAWLARQPLHPRLGRVVSKTLGTSSQVAVRLCVLTVIAMFALAEWLGLDPVLGAFTAGILVHLALESSDPEEAEIVESRLEGIGFGFLIPVFFILSGVNLDVESLVSDPSALAMIPLYLLLFLLVRGVPTFVLHQGALGRADQVALSVMASAALPLIVVITTVGVGVDVLEPAQAAALVSAGILSVLLFPLIAARIRLDGTNAETGNARQRPDTGAPDLFD